MSEALDNMEDVPEAQFEATDRPDNLMEALRKQREAARTEKFFELPVQGYNGTMTVRYTNAIPWLVMRDIMQRAEKDRSPMATLFASIDILARCTSAIKVRLSTDEPYETIVDAATGVPAPWGGQPMNEFFQLNLPDPTARNVMRAVFPNDIAISAAAGRLMGWVQNMSDEDGEEVAGE